VGEVGREMVCRGGGCVTEVGVMGKLRRVGEDKGWGWGVGGVWGVTEFGGWRGGELNKWGWWCGGSGGGCVIGGWGGKWRGGYHVLCHFMV